MTYLITTSCVTRDQTQVLKHTQQMFYHWTTSQALYLFLANWSFEGKVANPDQGTKLTRTQVITGPDFFSG